MKAYCTQNTDRECNEGECCLISAVFKELKIPADVKHHHSAEDLIELNEGIKKVNILLGDLHEDCVKHLVAYAELNIRAMFLFHVCNKAALKEALRLFIKNLNNLFLKHEA